jgi:hypothetical protein
MVKEADNRAKSKSRDRRKRHAAPTENLLHQEEVNNNNDTEDIIED